MDKLKELYNSYIEQGLISKETTFEQFSSANDDIKNKLYDQGVENNIISNITDFDTFKSAWVNQESPDTVNKETVKIQDSASVDPAVESGDMGSKLVDGSLEQQEPKIIDNETERYLQYNVDGKENLVYESDFNIGEDGLNFDEFAESNNLKIRESLAAPVIKTKSRKSFILDKFSENAYKKPKEISGFKDGMQDVFNNNLEIVDDIASSVNGINYATQGDESLENLDAFAQQNKDKTIVVYTEGEDDEGYKDSYNYVKDLYKKVNTLKKIRLGF